MTWMRYIAGRLKSDYRYSSKIVYNNYPWPVNLTEKQHALVEEKAMAILDARSQFPDASLADLYDAVAMPTQLRKAHTELDKAVDTVYGKKNFTSEAERIAFLFELYQRYSSLIPPDKPVRKRRARRV